MTSHATPRADGAAPDPIADLAAEAVGIVTGARRGQYGAPERNFAAIAGAWTWYLTTRGHAVAITAADVAAMMRLFKEARLATGDGRHRDSYVDLIGYALAGAEVAATMLALQAADWIIRGLVPWDKTDAARPQLGRFKSRCEYVVWATNGARPMRGVAGPGLLVSPSVAAQKKRHLAEKPLAIMAGLLSICPPGGRVLDPFAGSGSTGEAAAQTGRRAVMIERDPVYIDVMLARFSGRRVVAPAHGPLFAGERC